MNIQFRSQDLTDSAIGPNPLNALLEASYPRLNFGGAVFFLHRSNCFDVIVGISYGYLGVI